MPRPALPRCCNSFARRAIPSQRGAGKLATSVERRTHPHGGHGNNIEILIDKYLIIKLDRGSINTATMLSSDVFPCATDATSNQPE
jgi:hypothetical protein